MNSAEPVKRFVPSLAQLVSTLLASAAVRIFLALIDVWAGFDVAEYLVRLVIEGPAQPGTLELIRYLVAFAIAAAAILLTSRVWSARKVTKKKALRTLVFSSILLALALVSYVSFTAGQERPNLETILKHHSPITDVVDAITPPKLILFMNTARLIPFMYDIRLVAYCRIVPEIAIDLYADELQRSSVHTVSNELEIELSLTPGYPLWDRLCKDKDKDKLLQCAIRAVEMEDSSDDVDELEGTFFEHVTRAEITPEEQICAR